MIATKSILVTREVRESWRPPQQLSPADWASRHVILPPDAPIRGRLDHRNAPYLPGIINLASRRGIHQLNVQKAGQIGVSAALRWLMGYWAELDPAPCGLTLPDAKKGKKIIIGDLIPFFRGTAVLRALMTNRSTDESGEIVRLMNGFTLHLMWAGSASSTASFPLRRVANDETDKMQAWGRGGGEGHAVHRTGTRLRVFADTKLQVNVSTPTSTSGMIYLLVEDSDWILYFLVECPHCGERIKFVPSQLKWEHYQDKPPRKDWAARVLAESAAWYECQACGGVISERQRKIMVQNGRWGTADEYGVADGRIEDAEAIEEWPMGTTLGLRVSALYCMWETWAKIARDWILALGSMALLYTFITETLGEPFEQQVEAVKVGGLEAMSAHPCALPEGIVPWWASCLLAGIDTQKDYFWLIIRAFGPGMRSARVFHDRVETFEELERLCFGTPWAVEDERYAPKTCDLAVIDSGGTGDEVRGVSRTMAVYAWALKLAAQVKAIKGSSKPLEGQFHKQTRGWYDVGKGHPKIEVPLWLLDTHHYQDELASQMRRTVEEEDADGNVITEPMWRLNQRVDPVYNSHMTNFRKVAERKGDQIVQVWRPVPDGARVDFRAIEGYLIAAAYMHYVHLLPSLADFEASRQAALIRRNRPLPAPTGITMPDGRPFIAEN